MNGFINADFIIFTFLIYNIKENGKKNIFIYFRYTFILMRG